MDLLKFGPFSSAADPSFWHALTQEKLERFKLSADPVCCELCLFFVTAQSVESQHPALLCSDNMLFASLNCAPVSLAIVLLESLWMRLWTSSSQASRSVNMSEVLSLMVPCGGHTHLLTPSPSPWCVTVCVTHGNFFLCGPIVLICTRPRPCACCTG